MIKYFNKENLKKGILKCKKKNKHIDTYFLNQAFKSPINLKRKNNNLNVISIFKQNN